MRVRLLVIISQSCSLFNHWPPALRIVTMNLSSQPLAAKLHVCIYMHIVYMYLYTMYICMQYTLYTCTCIHYVLSTQLHVNACERRMIGTVEIEYSVAMQCLFDSCLIELCWHLCVGVYIHVCTLYNYTLCKC